MNALPKPDITVSDQWYAKAREIIPAGSQTFSKGVTQFVEGFAPKYLARGKGCRVWDVDGNEYLDYVMGCHPLVLGYADPDVNAAVARQLEEGSTFSLMHPLEVEVAQLVIEAVPCAEAVRFGKNGADATTVAVRVARAVTGRDHIAYCGYHGWHDWFIANTDLNSGIPRFNQELAHTFTYNDLESLERVFRAHPGQIAGVIMEPLTILEPNKGFLEGVREMTRHYGALLIFDEVITGFRFALGGAQELTGVTPDLATFAKGISNGIPLSAIAGRKEYMFALEKTFFSFTYGGECLGLAAARACIPKIRHAGVIDHLWHTGRILQEGFNRLAAERGVADFVQCIGYPCRTIVSIDGQNRFDALEIKSYLQQELLRRGVLWAAYHAMSFAHQEADIQTTLAAFDDALKLLRQALDGPHSLRSCIEGIPVRPVFRKVTDFNAFIASGKKAPGA